MEYKVTFTHWKNNSDVKVVFVKAQTMRSVLTKACKTLPNDGEYYNVIDCRPANDMLTAGLLITPGE